GQRTATTFDDLFLAYLREVTPSKRAPERDYYSAKHLRPSLTKRLLSDIDGQAAREYIAKRKDQGASPGTINKEIGLASAAWNWGKHELELNIENPWQTRRLKEPSGRARWLSRDEAERLLEAARNSSAKAHLPAFIQLCLYTGLRPGEALALTWPRVDFGRNRLILDADDSKNGKPAEVPISPTARLALIERARFRAQWCPSSPWVFCRRNGERIAQIKHGFASAAAAAGLVDVHPHDLRRTCGSWLVQAGVGIERVSAILRHSDIDVTSRVYAHLRPSDLADALEHLEAHAQHPDSSHSIVTLDKTDEEATERGSANG
ncbi:MAG: site-specific integrase, partial [Chromatiaceae bacterium]|nr:site-specific integrase [Chromatiaceae bacterium]